MLWRNEWTEAVLIADADNHTPDLLVRMARHLADPEIGAVTAYIKEGSRSRTTSSATSRLNTSPLLALPAERRTSWAFFACLSGGAQLHSRENLLAIGGQIFSDTLAEDTFTTFRTQLSGRRAL